MKIKETYSHLGGSEILKSRYPDISDEIDMVISNVEARRIKESKENKKKGKMLYAPRDLNKEFEREFKKFGFSALRLDFKAQLKYPELNRSYKQIDYTKDRIHVEVQFGKYSFMFYDMSKFQHSHNENYIDVGVEIVPTYDMAVNNMSSGVSYGEQLINDIVRLRRNYPSVPVKIIMIEP